MSSFTIGVLLIKDDPINQKVVQKILPFCMYRVLYVGKVMDALKALWDAKDRMNLCLTNVHRLEMVGSRFHDRLQEEFKLPILKMTPDDKLIEWKGDNTEAAAYILNDLKSQVIRQIWQQEMGQGNNAAAVVNQEIEQLEMAQGENVEEDVEKYLVDEEDEQTEEKVGDGEQLVKDSEEEEGGENGEEQDGERHPRIRWTPEMHQKFLDALMFLGPHRAFPKKILEMMNIPGLTRAHVASHLQKHRINLKRIEEQENPRPGGNNNVSESSSFFSYHPLSSLQGYPGRTSLLSARSPFDTVSSYTPAPLLQVENFQGSQYPVGRSTAPLLPMAMHPNIALRGLTLPASYNYSNRYGGLITNSSINPDNNKVHQLVQGPLVQNQCPSNPVLFQQQHSTDVASNIPILQPQTLTQPSEHGSNVFVDPIGGHPAPTYAGIFNFKA